jgi:preprotein translocase subunit SecB
MAEEQTTPSKNFSIQKIYTKDISFETPSSPKIFTEKWEPTVDFNLGTHVQNLDENLFEVALSITVTVKCQESTAYLVEVNQAGIFAMSGFNEQELSPMLGSFCPNILFPYAREAISDIVTKGGFPQLLLAPVNFDAIYAQHIQQNSSSAQEATLN